MISLDAMPVPLVRERGFAWVDPQDHESAVSVSWYMHSQGYAYRPKPTIYLHSLISRRMGISGDTIDHADRNRLNCTRENLRAATFLQNMANCTRKKSNTSGFKGVCKYTDKRWNFSCWVSKIRVGGTKKSIGYFHDIEAAARVYDEWAYALHGEFACLNFPRGS